MKNRALLLLFFKRLSCLLLANTAIAGFIYIYNIIPNFYYALTFSQSIGTSIFLVAWTLALFCEDFRWGWIQGIAGIATGTLIGTTTGFLLTGMESNIHGVISSDKFYPFAGLGILFGFIVTYFFWSRDKMYFAQEELHQKHIHILETEKNLVALQLSALQAQIEPHFLFNTLSNILSLIETNPQRSHAMLERFTLYLRGSLEATRENTIQLGEEVKNVAAYLDVIKFRMGDRLKIDIDIPDELHQTKIPPMLILSLVENSIKHGLEPKVEGGAIKVMAEKNKASTIITIEDTGMGIQGNNSHTGIGLANTRERLALFSHNNANMTIEPNRPQGTKVTISLPLDHHHG